MYLRRDTEGTDKEVVECCDVLLPFAGETFGSSRRENEGLRIRKRFYDGTMYNQLFERLHNKIFDEDKDSSNEEIKTKIDTVIKDAFEPYFKLFDDEPHDRAGFGLGVGRLAQFLLGRTEIVEL